MSAASGLYTHVVTGRCQALATAGHHMGIWTRGCKYSLELLMMSGVPLETCWAFNKLCNNKFYYKAASCWYFYWVTLRCTDPWVSNGEFLFRDLHEREIKVVLYRGLNMCHLCSAQIDLPDVWGMNLVMGEKILKCYWVTAARATGAALSKRCAKMCVTQHLHFELSEYTCTRLLRNHVT